MKQVIKAVGATRVPASVKAGKFFFWQTAVKMFNAIPLEMAKCETVEDAKVYASVLSVILFFFVYLILEANI